MSRSDGGARLCGGVGRDALFLLLVLTASNASAYVFHVVMTRLLGPADYGTVGALLTVVLILGVPTAALQAVVARRVAAIRRTDGAAVRCVGRSALGFALRAGAGAAALIGATAPWTARFLHMDSPTPVVLIALLAVPSLVAPVGRGLLQGSMRFGTLGLAMFGAMALRLALGIVLVGAGLGVTGAVLAVLLSEIGGAGFALLPVASAVVGPRADRDVAAGMGREAGGATAALLGFWVMVSIDTFLARHYLPAAEAGHYAAAALVGKAVLFLPMAVAMVAYPRFAEHPGARESERLLRLCLLLVGGVGLAVSIGVAAFPQALTLAFGSSFRFDGRAVPLLLALAMSAFGAVSLLVHYRLALGRAPVRGLWLAAAAEAAAIAAFHRDGSSVAAVVLASGCLLACGLWPGSQRRARAVRAEGELWQPADARVALSVVTPTFNGERTLAPNLAALLSALEAAGIPHEVIVVSDGSTDGTLEAARPYVGNGVRLLHYPRNRGKGHALRTGMERANGRTVAFIDSDGDLDPGDLVRFLTLMQLYDADMVVGSKRHPLSELAYPLSRRVMSWSYHKLVALLFGVRLRDTQTGIKLMRRELLAEVLPRLVEKRFAFDLELIVAARRAGYRRILEAPVRLRFRFTSTISRRAVAGILRDTAAIWYRRYVRRQYDPEPVPRASEPVPRLGLERAALGRG